MSCDYTTGKITLHRLIYYIITTLHKAFLLMLPLLLSLHHWLCSIQELLMTPIIQLDKSMGECANMETGSHILLL